MQDLDEATFGGLIAAQHAAGQREWTSYIIAAELPNLPRVLTETRSYVERFFNDRSIGQLNPDEATQALSSRAPR